MTRSEVIERITHVRDWLAESNYPEMTSDLTAVLEAFATMNHTAAQILGAAGGKKGGNTPVKPGSRPRGRPRKDAISETPSKAVE